MESKSEKLEAELDVDRVNGITGTPISLVPELESGDEPEDPEEPDDEDTPPGLREDHSRFVFRITRNRRFKVTIKLNAEVENDSDIDYTEDNAAIQLSFTDNTGGSVGMPAVLVRYRKNAQKPKKLVSDWITASAPHGDVIMVARRAIVTKETPLEYILVQSRRPGDKRRCRVGCLKILAP